MSGFCTECGTRIESFDGLNACPSCGTTNIPCLDENQVNISINWQELRVLVMWAENWQRANDLGRTVYAIAKRIKAQHPDRIPLTLAEELGDIAKEHNMSVNDPALRRDIAEQTGEETGLFHGPKPDILGYGPTGPEIVE